MGRGLKLHTGRVIALGRLLLAACFLGAIAIDVSQPSQAPDVTYSLLAAYVVFAFGIVAMTWRDWWLDAKLAGPAHAIDIALFVGIVFLTDGYTSPFFVFFIFLLLAAAIRWGWRETALTAILVSLLYILAGLYAAESDGFLLYRFVIRAGQLVIVSLILIWFGVHQWRARVPWKPESLFSEPLLDRSPLETGLSAAMTALGASSGAILWSETGLEPECVTSREGQLSRPEWDAKLAFSVAPAPFLYDVAKGRTLHRNSARSLIAREPTGLIGEAAIVALDLREGLAVPVRAGTGEGQIYLEGIRGLSIDHLDFGEQLAADVTAHIHRHALLKVAAENAEAGSRFALARDLHDSVVQFLAGAAFRLEAMKRSSGSGRSLEPELNELKQLMMQEQGELRAFITALRSGPLVAVADLARDLQALADRLSRQWDIDCDFSADTVDAMVSSDLHLDIHQLVREGVANAVRHAGAKSVRVALAAEAKSIRLEMINDGRAYPKRGEQRDLPHSLRERVEQAGGAIELSRGMGVTRVSISLPIAGRAA